MPRRSGTTIQQWMERYNAEVNRAFARGINRGPNGRPLHILHNLRVSNETIADRTLTLRAFLDRSPIAPSVAAPLTPSIRTPRSFVPIGARLPLPLPSPITTTSGPTFGVEIECLFPQGTSMTMVERTLNAAGITTHAEMYNHSRRAYWKIVTDGSLRANPGTITIPYEMVSPILSGSEGLEQITKVCAALNSLHPVVNRSCGFHVHIGISSDLDNVHFYKRLIRLYKAHINQIESILAPSRRQAANAYCRDFRAHTDRALEQASSVEEVIRLVNGPNPQHDRYYKVNLNAYFRHRTIEFRQHQGTLDAQKAIMWTRFCLKLVAAATKTTTFVTSDSLAGLLDQIEASEEERTYFLSRQAHFQQLENSGDF